MASLPFDIITEILVRLSVKSLIRFLCVNKSWYSLIKSPNFIKLHFNKTLISNSETHLIVSQGSLYIADFNLECIQNPISFSELDHPLKTNYIKVIGSCNGILCISDCFGNDIILYNPLTNFHRELLVKRIRDFESSRVNWVAHGFGYDSVTDDYKIFCYYPTSVLRPEHIRGAEVFSFKRNSWKSVEGIDFKMNPHKRVVYLNDAMYFVVEFDPDLNYGDPLDEFLVKFDLRSDTLSRVEHPKCDDKLRGDLFWEASVLNGCLCMFSVFVAEFESVDLWMRNECGENEAWVRLFSIPELHDIRIPCLFPTIICSNDGCRVLLSVTESHLGWYDLDNGSFEIITELPSNSYRLQSMCYFSGSLVSLVEDK